MLNAQVDKITKRRKNHHRLVVKFADDFLEGVELSSNTNDKCLEKFNGQWDELVRRFEDLQIVRLFTSLTAGQITALMEKAGRAVPAYAGPNLFSYYAVDCAPEINLVELQDTLQKLEMIELVYILTAAQSPHSELQAETLLFPQGYLNKAPEGLDVFYAWKFNGGKGNNLVKFIDIEQGWQLSQNLINITTLPLSGVNELSFREHGFAVLNIIAKKENTKGSIGITPKASGHIISEWRSGNTPNQADAILSAIHYLNEGDILLLESQSYNADTGSKLWPVEIQDACFWAIRMATALGITVIEAAGNGDAAGGAGNNLDHFLDNGKKILDTGSKDFRDSGAIMVTAASLNTDHRKIYYANYGNRIDCYAWGEGVVASGEFTQPGQRDVFDYSIKLNGTSAAAAIIAGAAIAVQSLVAAMYNTRLSPLQMRWLLSNEAYGTASVNGKMQDKIGVMPDLRKIIDSCLLVSPAGNNKIPSPHQNYYKDL